jgi:hypothetical protein
MYQQHLSSSSEEDEEEEVHYYDKKEEEEKDVWHIKHLFINHKINHHRVCYYFV